MIAKRWPSPTFIFFKNVKLVVWECFFPGFQHGRKSISRNRIRAFYQAMDPYKYVEVLLVIENDQDLCPRLEWGTTELPPLPLQKKVPPWLTFFKRVLLDVVQLYTAYWQLGCGKLPRLSHRCASSLTFLGCDEVHVLQILWCISSSRRYFLWIDIRG